MKKFCLSVAVLTLINLTACINESKDSSSLIDIEQSLKEQLSDYFDAVNSGDSQKVSNYLHPVLFEWAENEFSYDEEYSKESLINFFIDGMQNLKNYAEQNHYDYGVEIKDVTRRITFNEQLIYLVETVFYAQKDDKRQEVVSVIICISEDKGKTWRFLEKDEESDIDEVLLLKFPSEIVEEIAAN